jgi:Uma2 family endonuclease
MAGMVEPAQKRLSIAEFLSWDDGTDRRYELVRGEIVAMAPPSPAHGTIAGNVVAIVHPRLKPPCRVIIEAGIALPDRDDTYYQADLAITCAPPSAEPTRFVEEPRVVFEIVSPSTAKHDFEWKSPDYQGIPGIEEIVYVWSNRRHAQHWHRTGDQWLGTIVTGGSLALRSFDIELAFEAIYANTGI